MGMDFYISPNVLDSSKKQKYVRVGLLIWTIIVLNQ